MAGVAGRMVACRWNPRHAAEAPKAHRGTRPGLVSASINPDYCEVNMRPARAAVVMFVPSGGSCL